MSDPKIINLAERKAQSFAGNAPVQGTGDIPDFIRPADISTMTDVQLEQVLNLVRMRRMQSALTYEKTREETAAVAAGRARAALVKKSEQVFTSLSKAFGILDKLEVQISELRALRVQAGLEF